MISYQNVDLKTPIKAKATIRNILKHILCLKGSGARTEELLTFRGSSQMTLALFWVSYTPWWLCQTIFIFWPIPWWTDLNQKPSFLESRLFPLVLMSVAYNIGHCLEEVYAISH